MPERAFGVFITVLKISNQKQHSHVTIKTNVPTFIMNIKHGKNRIHTIKCITYLFSKSYKYKNIHSSKLEEKGFL